MADKVKELGFDVEKFKKELFALNDKLVDKCTIALDFRSETIRKEIYPELKVMKEKYGIDIPLGFCGVDMPRLDSRLDTALLEKKIQVAKEHGGFKSQTEKEFIDTFSPKVDKPPKKPPYVKA